MTLWSRTQSLIRNLFSMRGVDNELDAEVRSYADLLIDENVAAGMSTSEARRQVVAEMGGIEQIKQSTRDARFGTQLERLWQDLRYALRRLRKSPGFTITAILTLALGIGALTTIATWTNAVLYNPWPRVAAPRQIHFIDATVLGNQGYSVHYDQYQFLRKEGRSWQDAIAFAQHTVNLTDQTAEALAIPAGIVSSNYFQFLGLQPQAGQFFQANADDHAFGAQDEIMLSDALWRDQFHADPGVVGRTLSVNHHPFVVVGIAPKDFAGIFGGVAENAWLPLSTLRSLDSDAPPDPLQHYGLQVAVRLKPGVSGGVAAAEVHTLARAFAHNDMKGWDLNLRDSAHFERGLFILLGEQLPLLAGASALLMVLVCLNIASLLGQRAARYRREIAIRSALGAPPRRIVTQVLTETGVLAAAGALTGWAASLIMSRGLFVLLPDWGIPLAFNFRTDGRTLLFVTVVGIFTSLACGLYPVRQALQISQNEALREGVTSVAGRGHRQLGRRIVLSLQLAICFVVLVGCTLLVRTAFNIASRTTGFDTDHILTASVDLSRAGYAEQRGLLFQTKLLDKIRSLPGIDAATLSSHLPMGDDGSGNTTAFSVPGYVPAKNEDMGVITDHDGPGFFHILGIALRSGRDFADSDTPTSAPVAIVNEAMAHRYWPHGDALGSTVIVDKQPRRVVGVVSNFLYSDPADTDAPAPVLFLPLAQGYWGSPAIVLRTRVPEAEMAPLLRQAVKSLDPSLPLEDMRSMRAVIGERYQLARIPAKLLTVYALSSILVAMLGLYAVVAYSVIERYREFALRMALGSSRSAIFRLVLRGNAGTAALGLAIGAIGSILAVRALHSLLYGVALYDPLSYAAAALCLVLTVLLSGVGPAHRASTIEPMRALRTE